MEILKEINDLQYWDWELYKYDGCNLTIAAGINLSYGHSLEICFFEVAYINCPTYFYHALIRMADRNELESIAKVIDLENLQVFAIEAETDCLDLGIFLIAANSIQVKQGIFSH